jgi:ankyrin repeat protein
MNQQRRLLEACRQCDINAVKNEILMGASASYFVDDNDFLPIHAAAQSGSIQLVQWLIVEAKANINSQCRTGETALHVACVNNHQELAQWLVISGSDLLITNLQGNTAIHSACASSHASLVQSLLKIIKNFEINLRNSRNETLLHVSCRAASLECIFLLLENHCDILVQDDLGQTPLHHACISCTTIAVKTLLNAGAILPVKDHEGYTPFHVACEHGNFDVAEYLLTLTNCPINTVTNRGDTCLHCACTGKNIDLVMLLLEAGQDIDGCNLLDETPFEKAMSSGSLDICKLLVNQGANPNRINSVTGQSSMHLAAKYGNLRLAMWLAKKNVALDEPDNSGMTPFLIAAKEGQLELLRWFRDTEEVNVNSCDKGQNSALHYACEGGHSRTIKWLLSIGLDSQQQNSSGLTPIQVSQSETVPHDVMETEKKSIEMMKLTGGDVETMDDLETTICALEESLRSNDFVIARKIVESLNLFDTESVRFPFGKTLLHYGAACGHLEYAQYLIIGGKEVDALTESRRTPLFYAAGKGHLEMVKFLCSHGADPTAKDIYGTTCLSMAIKHHHPEIIQWFSGVIAEHNGTQQQQQRHFLTSSSSSVTDPTAFLFSCVADHHTQLPPHGKSSNLFPSDGIICDEQLDDDEDDDDIIEETLNRTTTLTTSTHHQVLTKGGNIHRQEEELFTACRDGDLVKARYLIENGVPLSLHTKDENYSLLHLSCLSGSIGLVKYFIHKSRDGVEKTIDLNSRCHDGSTPLHLACDKQFPEIALCLIEAGARVDLHRNDGMSILHLVCSRGMRNLLCDIINLPRSKLPHLDLEETDAHGCNLLHVACRVGNLNLVMFLLSLDLYDINGSDSFGRTPLHYACMSNSVEVVMCLSKSNEINIDPHDRTDCTPLLMACKSGNINLVRWLYQRGANLFTMTHSKNTALHIAAAIGDQKILEYLIATGLTSCHENLNGYSPVQLAYQNGHDETVEYLLRHTKALPPNKVAQGQGSAGDSATNRVQIDLTLLN